MVYDTVRMTTTVQLNAEGDTTRTETRLEHITDRTSQQRNENIRKAVHQENHEGEKNSEKSELVFELQKRHKLKPILCGVALGIILTIAAILPHRAKRK